MKRKKRRAPLGYIKRGDRFYFNFTESGKRIRDVIRKATTEEEAKTEVMRRKLAIREGRDGAPDKSIPLDEFLDTVYLPWSKLHKRTYYLDTRYAELFREYFKGKTLAEITPLVVEQFQQHRREGWTVRGGQRSAASVDRELTILSSVLAHAVNHSLLESNPCHKVKRFREDKERERVVTAEEEELILSSLTGHLAKLRPLVILALYTGMRRGEMLKLRWSDVNFETRKIRVQAESAKSKKRRDVEMNSIVSETLRPLRDGVIAKGLVFSGKGYSPASVTNMFSRLCDKLELNGKELSDVTLHTLRHTLSTRMKDNGENPFVMRDAMGHARIYTTEGYTHDTAGTGQQAVQRLEKYAKWRASDTSLPHNDGQPD